MIQLTNGGKVTVNIILIFLSVVLGSLFFFIPFVKRRKEISLKDFFNENKYLVFLGSVFAIGFISRVAFIDLLPGGLNQDEASAGYDAYAILKYGIDRNGIKYPMHLIAWGSGQNALYSYLCMPFMLILGVNEISLRLPMAIIGCVSIFLLYLLLKKKFDERTALIGTIFLIICPWHLMKCRWGLESNLFPDLVFIGFYFLMIFLEDKKIYKLCLSSFILGLSAYSYGTSYFFLFFFVISFLVYLMLVKKIKWYESLVYLSIIGVMSLPIMIFLDININDKETVNFLWFTIPKLTQNRFQTVTNIFSNEFFKTGKENLVEGLKQLFVQYDNLPWNGIPVFGQTYIISMPFTLIGLFHKDEKHSSLFWLLRIWLIVVLAMLFIVSPNTNRINIIFFPMIILTIFGILDVVNAAIRLKKIIFSLYMVSFLAFFSTYTTKWNDTLKSNFFYSFGSAIEYAERIDDAERCYVTSTVNMPYVFVLYYTEYDVNEFIETVNYANPGGSFQWVTSFGKYYFYLPDMIREGNVYIVSYWDDKYKDVDLSMYEVTYFENYYVIDTTI